MPLKTSFLESVSHNGTYAVLVLFFFLLLLLFFVFLLVLLFLFFLLLLVLLVLVLFFLLLCLALGVLVLKLPSLQIKMCAQTLAEVGVAAPTIGSLPTVATHNITIALARLLPAYHLSLRTTPQRVTAAATTYS